MDFKHPISRSRKSGLRSKEEALKTMEDFSDYDQFIKPFTDTTKEYKQLKEKVGKKEKAYVITYTKIPDILFISFSNSKDKAKGIATRYFRDNLHPAFISWKVHTQARAIRHPELDKYSKFGRVPVTEILKLGASIPCFTCGKHDFTLKDLEQKRCFIIDEGENLNIFTSGIIVCWECFNKYFK